jgi:hypothetical protein
VAISSRRFLYARHGRLVLEPHIGRVGIDTGHMPSRQWSPRLAEAPVEEGDSSLLKVDIILGTPSQLGEDNQTILGITWRKLAPNMSTHDWGLRNLGSDGTGPSCRYVKA